MTWSDVPWEGIALASVGNRLWGQETATHPG